MLSNAVCEEDKKIPPTHTSLWKQNTRTKLSTLSMGILAGHRILNSKTKCLIYLNMMILIIK